MTESLNRKEMLNCLGSLAEAYQPYSPACLSQLFGGKKTSHILPYESHNSSEDQELSN